MTPKPTFDTGRFPHCAAAFAYAVRVAGGVEPAGEFVVLACERFLRDLEAGVWAFDPAKAERAMIFAELLPNTKGPLAGKALSLLDWQRFCFVNVFGFVDAAGNRRFRQAVIYVPRGNGKTTIAAPLACYMTFIEGEGGAEGYAAAVTADQARILFGILQQMVRKTPQLEERFGVKAAANAIFQTSSASSFKPISSDAKALDGLNVHCAVCDEIASHKTSEVYDVLLTALGKRAQPFLLSISTATANTSGIGRQLWNYAAKVLRQAVDDDRIFGVLYAADDGDDPWSEATWRKANPSWGVAVQPDAIAAIAKQARQSPASEAAFFTRHLNRWVSADLALFSLRHWERMADPTLTLEQFAGGACYIGLDLSTKTDLAAAALLFPPRRGGEPWHAFAQCYLPEAAVLEARNPSYAAWANSGELRVTPGDVIDFTAVEDDLLLWRDTFDVRAVAFDTWQATQLAQRMAAEGLEMVEFAATTKNFSEPTKELDALIRNSAMAHPGGGPLTWCLSNVVGHYDARANVYPRKERPENKIDAAIALIMALGKAIFDKADEQSVYRERGLLML